MSLHNAIHRTRYSTVARQKRTLARHIGNGVTQRAERLNTKTLILTKHEAAADATVSAVKCRRGQIHIQHYNTPQTKPQTALIPDFCEYFVVTSMWHQTGPGRETRLLLLGGPELRPVAFQKVHGGKAAPGVSKAKSKEIR